MRARKFAELDQAVNAKLAELIRLNRSARQGYDEAARLLDGHGRLTMFFRIHSNERANHILELSNLMLGGGDVEPATSDASRALTWAWERIHKFIVAGDEQTVLREMEESEQDLLDSYERCLDGVRGTRAYDTVYRQCKSVRSARDRLETMRGVNYGD